MPGCAIEIKKGAGYTHHLWVKYRHFGRQGNWEGWFVFVEIRGIYDLGKRRVYRGLLIYLVCRRNRWGKWGL